MIYYDILMLVYLFVYTDIIASALIFVKYIAKRKDSHIIYDRLFVIFLLKSAGDSMQSLISLIAYLLYPTTV